ncbi:MAG: hypothetical protein LBU82_06420 [Treponema sp.]|jgi:hypothetical protein|nr:hypothetical protein [Treponema sp.]
MMKKLTKLALAFLLTLPLQARAQNAEDAASPHEGLLVEVDIFPQEPVAGAPLTVTIFANYPAAGAVTVIAPVFPPQLALDRMVKAPKTREELVWTAVEYRLIPSVQGLYILEPFMVTCPAGEARTQPVVLEVSLPNQVKNVPVPRIGWEGVPSMMTAGEKANFSLRVSGLGSRKLPEGFFTPEVPRKAVLETMPVTVDEKTGAFIAQFSLIPMESGEFRLGARTLYHENARFDVPSLRIRVNEPASTEARPAETAIEPPAKPETRFPEIDLEGVSAGKPSPLSGADLAQIENICNEAKELWDGGCRAKALALLRRNERDHPQGALLRPVRAAAEESLGIFNSENENRNNKKYLLGLAVSLFAVVIITPFVCFVFFRGSFKRKALLALTAAFALGGFFCLYQAPVSRKAGGKDGRFGVTVETQARRVADYAGEELFAFKEGQPVIILQNSGSGWLRVRANEAAGGAGWVPEDAVIFY